MKLLPFPYMFKRAERKKIARWAILAKEPDCREGAGGRVEEAVLGKDVYKG